jgi:hypothetical protein
MQVKEAKAILAQVEKQWKQAYLRKISTVQFSKRIDQVAL